jgi:hypothetical protein
MNIATFHFNFFSFANNHTARSFFDNLKQDLETKTSPNPSYITTDGQLASLSWCQAPIWDQRPIFRLLSLIIFRQLRFVDMGRPL